MSRPTPKPYRLLAIALSSHGLGYAVLEGERSLVEYGSMRVKGDKNRKCVAKIEELVALYTPDGLVLEEMTAQHLDRAPRIKTVQEQIIESGRKCGLKVTLVSGKQVRSALLDSVHGTKQEVAQMLTKYFPDELAFRLPPKRRAWESADDRMDIFDAVGLAVAFRMTEQRTPVVNSSEETDLLKPTVI